jgi:hypothetical protein
MKLFAPAIETFSGIDREVATHFAKAQKALASRHGLRLLTVRALLFPSNMGVPRSLRAEGRGTPRNMLEESVLSP